MAQVKSNTDGKVTVFLPKIPGDSETSLWVAVNGKAYSVPRGKQVEVDPSVAAVLEARERFVQKGEEYSQKAIEMGKHAQGTPV